MNIFDPNKHPSFWREFALGILAGILLFAALILAMLAL